jgi:rare lipoprotein A
MTRAHQARFAGVLLLAALIVAGCGGGPRRAEPAVQAGTAPEPSYGGRGNPPFYEVFGRRYHVLPTSAGYLERGVASWYGRDFHGLTTSGGEIYDMHALTAAHPTLPIPTWVEVTHVGNGKRVTVRINDRGPFVGDRIIDLSYRAAQMLDMVNEGTALVEVRALETPAAAVATAASVSSTGPAAVVTSTDPRPAEPSRGFSIINEAAAATPTQADQPLRQMFVQVGAFSEHANALRMVQELRAGGYPGTFVVSSNGGDGLHRVRVPVRDEAEFDRVTDGLRSLGLGDTRLVVGP